MIEWVERCNFRQQNLKCWRYNRYGLSDATECTCCDNDTCDDTVLHMSILHCPLGLSCPTYYSRRDVMRHGFRPNPGNPDQPTQPHFPRHIYHALCLPHYTNCTCKEDRKTPEDIRLDKGCYCRVALANLVSICVTLQENSHDLRFICNFWVPSKDELVSDEGLSISVLASASDMMAKQATLQFQLTTKDGEKWVVEETVRHRVQRIYENIYESKMSCIKGNPKVKKLYASALESETTTLD